MASIRYRKFKTIRFDYVKLAIMIKYGGVFIDGDYFSVDSMDWIINITNYPS